MATATTRTTARFRVAELDGGRYEIRDHEVPEPESGREYTTCSGYSGDPEFSRATAKTDCAALNDGTAAPDPIWYRDEAEGAGVNEFGFDDDPYTPGRTLPPLPAMPPAVGREPADDVDYSPPTRTDEGRAFDRRDLYFF